MKLKLNLTICRRATKTPNLRQNFLRSDIDLLSPSVCLEYDLAQGEFLRYLQGNFFSSNRKILRSFYFYGFIFHAASVLATKYCQTTRQILLKISLYYPQSKKKFEVFPPTYKRHSRTKTTKQAKDHRGANISFLKGEQNNCSTVRQTFSITRFSVYRLGGGIVAVSLPLPETWFSRDKTASSQRIRRIKTFRGRGLIRI